MNVSGEAGVPEGPAHWSHPYATNGEDEIPNSASSSEHSSDMRRLNPVRALLLTHNLVEGIANIRKSWKILLVAQVLSLLLAMSGATNSTLNFDCKISAPTMQAGLVYFFLSFHLCLIPRNTAIHEYEEATPHDTRIRSESDANGNDSNNELMRTQPLASCRPRQVLFNRIPIQGSLKVYFIMAFLDVEANYLTYLSFRYTSLTSVSLLDALAIPSAMFFSRFILKRVYRAPHFFGAAICIIGILINILGDYQREKSNGNDDNLYDEGTDDADTSIPDEAFLHPIRGDIAATAGAILYGLNDVLTERMVKGIGVKEYLGVLGLFGSIICLLQSMILERDSVSDFMNINDNVCGAGKIWTLFGSSALFAVVSYTGMANFLRFSEAALLNLSLLTGDLWAALFSVLAEDIIPSNSFWVSLLLIVAGVLVYETSESFLNHDEMLVVRM